MAEQLGGGGGRRGTGSALAPKTRATDATGRLSPSRLLRGLGFGREQSPALPPLSPTARDEQQSRRAAASAAGPPQASGRGGSSRSLVPPPQGPRPSRRGGPIAGPGSAAARAAEARAAAATAGAASPDDGAETRAASANAASDAPRPNHVDGQPTALQQQQQQQRQPHAMQPPQPQRAGSRPAHAMQQVDAREAQARAVLQRQAPSSDAGRAASGALRPSPPPSPRPLEPTSHHAAPAPPALAGERTAPRRTPPPSSSAAAAQPAAVARHAPHGHPAAQPPSRPAQPPSPSAAPAAAGHGADSLAVLSMFGPLAQPSSTRRPPSTQLAHPQEGPSRGGPGGANPPAPAYVAAPPSHAPAPEPPRLRPTSAHGSPQAAAPRPTSAAATGQAAQPGLLSRRAPGASLATAAGASYAGGGPADREDVEAPPPPWARDQHRRSSSSSGGHSANANANAGAAAASLLAAGASASGARRTDEFVRAPSRNRAGEDRATTIRSAAAGAAFGGTGGAAGGSGVGGSGSSSSGGHGASGLGAGTGASVAGGGSSSSRGRGTPARRNSTGVAVAQRAAAYGSGSRDDSPMHAPSGGAGAGAGARRHSNGSPLLAGSGSSSVPGLRGFAPRRHGAGVGGTGSGGLGPEGSQDAALSPFSSNGGGRSGGVTVRVTPSAAAASGGPSVGAPRAIGVRLLYDNVRGDDSDGGGGGGGGSSTDEDDRHGPAIVLPPQRLFRVQRVPQAEEGGVTFGPARAVVHPAHRPAHASSAVSSQRGAHAHAHAHPGHHHASPSSSSGHPHTHPHHHHFGHVDGGVVGPGGLSGATAFQERFLADLRRRDAERAAVVQLLMAGNEEELLRQAEEAQLAMALALSLHDSRGGEATGPAAVLSHPLGWPLAGLVTVLTGGPAGAASGVVRINVGGGAGVGEEHLSYEELAALEDVKVVTPQDVLGALPVHGYKADSATESASSCVVCLCEFIQGDEVMRLPCCHILHNACGRKWLSEYSKRCPVCKKDVSA